MRVGKNPGTGQILSVVKGSNGQSITGAKISINRGLFNAPDTSNGTSTASNIPAGTWELSVTKTGFQPATQTVTVTKDLVSTVNVTLVP
ncbi:carboxypeptidase regulatory-like domain-containing protein [bacterium]|nr:carboxypeptidase regulatory-like domain-containing protein [bacterium]